MSHLSTRWETKNVRKTTHLTVTQRSEQRWFTASIQADNTVTTATIQLQRGVLQHFRTVERDWKCGNFDVSRPLMHWIRTSARTCFGYKSIRTEIGRLMHIRLVATDEIFFELTIDSCLQVQLCTQNLCSNWKIASIRLAHFPKWQVPKWQITIIATFFG